MQPKYRGRLPAQWETTKAMEGAKRVPTFKFSTRPKTKSVFTQRKSTKPITLAKVT